MKVIFTIILFVLAGLPVLAQQEAKVIAEIAAGNDRTIKNAPFSADAISESVQVLADGNRIVRSSTSKLSRNSEGRFRRELLGGSGGVLGTYFSFGEGTTILDPVAGHRVLLDSLDRTARIVQYGGGQNVWIARGGNVASIKDLTPEQKADLERAFAAEKNDKTLAERRRVELADKAIELERKAKELSASGKGVFAVSPEGRLAVGEGFSGSFDLSRPSPSQPKYETRTEDLGSRDHEGLIAEGTRRVTTIPAGAIGNERPIEIVYERWYSEELGLVIYSKHSDPRFGEQTYRITNLLRSEPDPSLFSVPNGYRVLSEGRGVYNLSTKPAPRGTVSVPRPAVQIRTAVDEKPKKP